MIKKSTFEKISPTKQEQYDQTCRLEKRYYGDCLICGRSLRKSEFLREFLPQNKNNMTIKLIFEKISPTKQEQYDQTCRLEKRYYGDCLICGRSLKKSEFLRRFFPQNKNNMIKKSTFEKISPTKQEQYDQTCRLEKRYYGDCLICGRSLKKKVNF